MTINVVLTKEQMVRQIVSKAVDCYTDTIIKIGGNKGKMMERCWGYFEGAGAALCAWGVIQTDFQLRLEMVMAINEMEWVPNARTPDRDVRDWKASIVHLIMQRMRCD